jgi:urea transport system permease protein
MRASNGGKPVAGLLTAMIVSLASAWWCYQPRHRMPFRHRQADPAPICRIEQVPRRSFKELAQDHPAGHRRASRQRLAGGAALVLERWQKRSSGQREADGRSSPSKPTTARPIPCAMWPPAKCSATAQRDDLEEIKPNSGIRGLISGALVQFQLSDPDPDVRRASARCDPARCPEADLLPPSARCHRERTGSGELRARKERLERLLTIPTTGMTPTRGSPPSKDSGDLGVDVRGDAQPAPRYPHARECRRAG